MKSISWKVVLHDALLIVVGSIIFAIGVDIFEVPYGLAAGGVTGLAMVFSAVAETFGVALPSFILVTLACYFITKFKDSAVIDGAFAGIRPVTVGLIAASVIFMGQSAFAELDPAAIAIAVGTVVLVGKFKVSPIIIVVVSGVIGAI